MTALVWLYGVCALGAACNLPAWARLTLRWFRPYSPERNIVYLWMRLGMVLGSTAIAIGSYARMSGIIFDPPRALKPILFWVPWRIDDVLALPGWSVVLWVVPLAVSEVLFLVVAAMRARSVGKRPYAAWVFGAGAVAWAVAVEVVW